MDSVLYYIARVLVALLQSLPLTLVARIGRAGGSLAYWCDARHRRVAIQNLTAAFGTEKNADEIRALAAENFRRLGENYASAVKTAAMNGPEIKQHMDVVDVEKSFFGPEVGPARSSRVFAIGHFGNFELFAHGVHVVPGYRGATTYRALRSPALNRLLLDLRRKSGCLFFERRTEGAALREAARAEHLMIGLLADQHAGDRGLRLPFFGRDCATSKAPAIFALRFELPLHTAICYRVRLGHWRIEIGDRIPTHENGQPRSVEAIMLDVNRAFEVAVRRDPANWFWVHRRWKPAKASPPAKPAVTEPNSTSLDPDGERI